MATTRSNVLGERHGAAGDHDEPAVDRLREFTFALRRRGWSEDSILALKVAVTLGGMFSLAYVIALLLNEWGFARFLLS